MLFSNPFDNPIFIPVIIRLGYILFGGIIIVVVFNINHLKTFFKSETWRRYYGWLIMAPTFITGIFLGKISSLIMVVYIIYRATKEYSRMLHLSSFYTKLILFNGFISMLVAILIPQIAYFLPAIYLIVIISLTILRNQLDNVLNFATHTLFASIWICYGMTHFILITQNLENGIELLLMLGFSIALSDVMAYTIGNLFSKIGFGVKYKIAAQISPNKTYAGFLGNLGGAAIGVFLLSFACPALSLNNLLILVCIVGVFSILGDLMESMVKRYAGMKDSGSSIPGHGGFLDRIDSLLITAIASYYYFVILKEFV